MIEQTNSRYPFGIPMGWFAVAESPDIAVAETKALYYFDRHLVLWRDEDGFAHVQDAFCPHLGAHLGHGATVEGCQIVCPFHGWKFDGEGANTEIPYSERTNRKARIETYPVIERNGFVYTWHHPHGEEPTWEPPEVPEIDSGDFSGPTRTKHTVAAHVQEMGENGVDAAHFRYVHNVAEVPIIERYEPDGHLSLMESKQRFQTPRGTVDGRIDSTAYGPGISIVRFSGIVDTLLVTATTPIDAENSETRFNFYVRSLGDAATDSTVGEAFAAEVDRQFLEDVPIWEHKAHLVRPALADTDGPFMKFRRWYSQFYVEETGDERTVFPPPYWPHKMDETPAKATASARLDLDRD